LYDAGKITKVEVTQDSVHFVTVHLLLRAAYNKSDYQQFV
jgi:hypothetical protein